jgi:DNA-binding GntR family transcriptional regulator
MTKDKVLSVLRDSIFSGSLKPGEKLHEKDLCERLGVSRTPVREAIRMLEAEGLVESIPNKGSRVAEISISDVINIYELRINLESMATRKAVPHVTKQVLSQLQSIQSKLSDAVNINEWNEVDYLNQQFHSLLFSAGTNDRLITLVEQLSNYGHMMTISAFAIPGRAQQVVQEHNDILQAVVEGDAEKAGSLMQKHLEVARDNLLAHLNEMIQSK